MTQFTLPQPPTVHTTIYNDLKGVDFSSDPTMVYKKRSPTGLNMISDEGGNPKKRTGWEVKKPASSEKMKVFDGTVTPVEASPYEVCRLNGITESLIDTELHINGSMVRFNAFSDTDVACTAKHVDASGNILAYLSRTKSQNYASLYIKTDSSLYESIKGASYNVQIYKSATSGGVRDMWSFQYGGESHLICLIGKQICRYAEGTAKVILECETVASKVLGFFSDSDQGGTFCMICDNEIYQYKNAGSEVSPDFRLEKIEPYVPTVLISRSPTGVKRDEEGKVIQGGGGEVHEGVNLLTRKRKEAFLGDDTSTEYHVASQINTTEPVTITAKDSNGVYTAVTGFTIGADGFTVKLPKAYPPVVTGEDNVMIEYTATGTSEAGEKLRQCQVATIYEKKVFLAGGAGDYGAYVWYSSHLTPAYWPDQNYLVIGNSDTNIMGLVPLGEYLGVVKEGDDSNSTTYLVYSTTLEDNTAYACKQSISGIGAVSQRTFRALGGEQLFLSKEGICGINAESVKNRSFYVNKQLCSEKGMENAISVTWNGYYILCLNNHCYVLDSRQKTSWKTEWTNYLYECFYWENVPASAMVVYRGDLWFGTGDGRLCRFKRESEPEAFSDGGQVIPCEWSTPLDNDGATYLFKTMQKKGGMVTIESMAATSVDAYIKADNEEEEYLGSISANGPGLPVEFYFNKKKKKYKRLQLIFRNSKLNEGLKINEIVKSYIVGTYSKNKVVIPDGDSGPETV